MESTSSIENSGWKALDCRTSPSEWPIAWACELGFQLHANIGPWMLAIALVIEGVISCKHQ